MAQSELPASGNTSAKTELYFKASSLDGLIRD